MHSTHTGLSRGYNYLKQRPATLNELRYYQRLPKILRNAGNNLAPATAGSNARGKRGSTNGISATITEDSDCEVNDSRWQREKTMTNSKIMCSKLLKLRSVQDTASYRESFPAVDVKNIPLVQLEGRFISSGSSSKTDSDAVSSSGNLSRSRRESHHKRTNRQTSFPHSPFSKTPFH